MQKQKYHAAAVTLAFPAIYYAHILPHSGRKRAFRSIRAASDPQISVGYAIDCLLHGISVFQVSVPTQNMDAGSIYREKYLAPRKIWT